MIIFWLYTSLCLINEREYNYRTSKVSLVWNVKCNIFWALQLLTRFQKTPLVLSLANANALIYQLLSNQLKGYVLDFNYIVEFQSSTVLWHEFQRLNNYYIDTKAFVTRQWLLCRNKCLVLKRYWLLCTVLCQ